jgi:hypothetical protein
VEPSALELVSHHVGCPRLRYLAHRAGARSQMMKPGIGSYDKFKQMFEKYTLEAGKNSS